MDRLKDKSLKYITHAGGSIDLQSLEKLHQFCKKNKLLFISMYGASEATSRMSYLPFNDMKKRIGSIGKGLQKSFILKNDDNKKILKPFEKGELIYTGDNVCLGYANNWKDLIKGDENFSTINTGDEGYFDKDGFFFITGRKNRYIKIYGHRINLDDIEKSLSMRFLNCFVNLLTAKY